MANKKMKKAVPPKRPVKSLCKHDVSSTTIQQYMMQYLWTPLVGLNQNTWTVDDVRTLFQLQWRSNALRVLNEKLKKSYPAQSDRKIVCMLIVEAFYERARRYLYKILP